MKFVDRLKLGKHYKMERFIIMFFTLLFGMFLISGVSLRASIVDRGTSYVSRALYNDSFLTSRTNIAGTVDAVYRNKTNTKTFVLLHFADIQNISTDATDYQMFVTAADVEGNQRILDTDPTGSIYVFGSSGYMGLYLANSNGFKPQILDITIRANAEMVPAGKMADEGLKDASFAKFDQFKVYVNPGAQDGVLLDTLEGDEVPSVRDLYYEAVISSDLPSLIEDGSLAKDYSEVKIRSELDETLEKMRLNLSNVDIYAKRLRQFGQYSVQVPVLPDVIRGDIVDKGEDGTLTLVSNKTFSNGFDFDWRSGSVGNGYVDGIMDESNAIGVSRDSFISDRLRSVEPSESIVLSDNDWLLSNNEPLDSIREINPTSFTEINDVVTLYTKEVRDYHTNKLNYQVQLLPKLLWLEVRLDNIESGTTIHAGAEAVQAY